MSEAGLESVRRLASKHAHECHRRAMKVVRESSLANVDCLNELDIDSPPMVTSGWKSVIAKLFGDQLSCADRDQF